MPHRQRRANHEGTKPHRRKDGRWQVNVMLSGKIHSAYGNTAQQARVRAKDLVKRHGQGLDLIGAQATLEAFLTNWLETSVRRKRENTYRSYETSVRVHIVPHLTAKPLGEIPLVKLTSECIEAWIEDRRAAGLAPHTVWRLHAVSARCRRADQQGRAPCLGGEARGVS